MQMSFDDELIEWPVTITLYAHGTDETPSMEEHLVEETDLPKWWAKKYARDMIDATYEIAVEIECYKSGDYKIKRMYMT